MAGFLSACLMTLFETPFWGKFRLEGVVEWQVNQIFVSVILREKYQPDRRLKEALAMHLLHGVLIGAVIAVIFTTVLAPLLQYAWLATLLVSVLLWLIVPYMTRDWIESKGPVKFSRQGMLVSLIAHVIYGLSLGFLIQTLLS